MARKREFTEQPTILALHHHKSNYCEGDLIIPAFADAILQLQELFKNAAKDPRPRTVFVENSPSYISSIFEKMAGNSPMEEAVRLASKLGWKIVPLDKFSMLKPIFELGKKGPDPFDSDVATAKRYVMYNLRERYWTSLLKRLHPTVRDFIVLNPNHVEGFLQESGLSANRVIWFNQPEQWRPTSNRRLSVKELEAFRKKRKVANRTRRLKRPH